MALGEHCGALGWLGCAASLAGVALIVQGHAGMLWLQAALHGERALLLQANATAAADEHALSTIGVCFGLASSFFAALSYVGLRLLSDAGGALVHSTWFFIAGAAVSGAALLGGVPLALPTPGAAALLVMLTAGLFMAQMLLNHGVGLVPAPQAASYGVTQARPAVGAVVGARAAPPGGRASPPPLLSCARGACRWSGRGASTRWCLARRSLPTSSWGWQQCSAACCWWRATSPRPPRRATELYHCRSLPHTFGTIRLTSKLPLVGV